MKRGGRTQNNKIVKSKALKIMQRKNSYLKQYRFFAK